MHVSRFLLRSPAFTLKELGNGNSDVTPNVPPTPIVSTSFNASTTLFA